MVNILILNTKESERFPHKNEFLLKYTVDWLRNELKTIGQDYKVVYVTRENMKAQVPILNNLVHLESPDDDSISSNHRAVLGWVVEHFNPNDKFVQLQLTQPVRREGLLKDVIDKIENDNVVISYTMTRDDSWRIVDNGTLENVESRSDDIHRYLDGAIDGWTGNPEKIFDLPIRKKTWVRNMFGPIVDIDYRWEYHSDYIKGAQALCNQNEKF